MSSESGQRLSVEELKQRNAPQTMIPQDCPSKEEDRSLLHRGWTELERHQQQPASAWRPVSAQEALLRALGRQVGQLPTQSQLEALARNVAQIRETLKQAGKKKELSISPPSLETAISVIVWLALILLGTMVGMVVLRVIWSGLAALWSAVQLLIP